MFGFCRACALIPRVPQLPPPAAARPPPPATHRSTPAAGNALPRSQQAAAMTAWLLDVENESTPLATTGGHTWAAARRLAAYLSSAAPELGLHRPGLRILELGAGTGWLGATVARNLPDAGLVCLTEQADGLPWLAHNVALNAARGLPLGHVRVQACDWTEFAAPADLPGGAAAAGADGAAAAQQAAQQQQAQQAEQRREGEPPGGGGGGGAAAAVDLREERWDAILGSDLIYNEAGSRCLPRVLAALARPHTLVRHRGRWRGGRQGQGGRCGASPAPPH